MRNILVVVGSGMKSGNTYRLTDAFCKGAEEAGHVVNKVFLGDKKIVGCSGCGACQKNGNKCSIQDSMQDIYPSFTQCDTLLLASPLYFWSVSAQTKAFIERLYAISKEDSYPHRDTLLLMTAGDDNFWTFEQPVSYYRFFTKALGWTDVGIYTAGGCDGCEGNRHIDEKHLTAAYKMGLSLS
ncbi:flavodoxin family protein [Sedimentibacter hydroxybenzoicus DSM 7310]|uniref:Flavodoxin family protein n=1 Tax=Sedimentibacter hydroxybenzoicus DSM 7310 TaxID=1123245 RepID=A0A974GUZ4_SEDHY|nr:flavodoxin family protein [Sedimentibacter hydroxybenzoicus]NYB72846.1 flavodoxin family protein [Sedimentibacter hydroxybenzoicus DSM 7310]